MAMDDEVLEFNFEGITPAVGGSFTPMPKGEYTMQCVSVEKFFAKNKANNQPDPNRPGLHFTFNITMHPTFEGREVGIWHMLEQKSYPYLLNTLSCLVPEFDWQKNGLKIPMSALAQKIAGRPCNGLVSWELSTYQGKKRVNNSLDGLKAFDQSIIQPTPTEGNPPILKEDAQSPLTQQAASGVSPSEVNEFLNEWPGGSGPAPAATPAAAPADSGNFFDEPF